MNGALPLAAVTRHDGRRPAGIVPVGAVTACAAGGQTSEAWGWMLCDGRALVVARHAELFAVLGYRYGGSDANFHLPDYRGKFQRSRDSPVGAGAAHRAGAPDCDGYINYLIKFTHATWSRRGAAWPS